MYNRLIRSKKGESLVESIRRAKSSVKQLVIPGMFFEDMGITYASIDNYLLNGTASPEDLKILERYHNGSRHKRQMPAYFRPIQD